MNRKILTWLLSGLLFVGVVGFSIWTYYFKTSTSTNSITQTISATLINTNSDFANAQDFRKSGDFTQALAAYQTALTKTTDISQKAIIQSNEAYVTYLSGDLTGAVKLYKEIAANTSYTPVARAYALMYMGRMYYLTYDPSITVEIFKDEPYKSFFVQGDIALSYRHLFEYSSSFYPLAISELQVANWYAARIVSIHTNSSSTPEITADKAIVDRKIKSADAEIQRTKHDQTAYQLIPSALTLKASTIALLSSINLASSTQAEMEYGNALVTYTQYNFQKRSDAITRFDYASFLLNAYGKKRSADIIGLIKPIYTDVSYKTSRNMLFFKNAPENDADKRKEFQSLAQLDPGFKTFLVSLGVESN